MISRFLPLSLAMSSLFLLGGCASTKLTLADLDRIEHDDHPLSAWEYIRTRKGYHHVRHYDWDRAIVSAFVPWAKDYTPYRIPESTFRVDKRNETQRLVVGVRQDYIRFGLPDQKYQEVPYHSPLKRTWPEDLRKVFADHRNRDRPSRTMWGGFTIYADRIEGNRASGRVMVVRPEAAPGEEDARLLHPPRTAYADELAIAPDGMSMTLSGDLYAEWSRAMARSQGTARIQILPDMCRYEGDFVYGSRQPG